MLPLLFIFHTNKRGGMKSGLTMQDYEGVYVDVIATGRKDGSIRCAYLLYLPPSSKIIVTTILWSLWDLSLICDIT